MISSFKITVNGIDTQDYLINRLDAGKQMPLNKIVSSLSDDTEAAKYSVRWFDDGSNIQIASKLIIKMGVERDLVAIGMDIRNRKNKLGYTLLQKFLDRLYEQLFLMMKEIDELYYMNKFDANGKVESRTYSGRDLEDCFQMAHDALKGLAKTRAAVIENYDSGHLFSRLSKFEDEQILNIYENNTEAVEGAEKKPRKSKK
jgi:hypothetical protein